MESGAAEVLARMRNIEPPDLARSCRNTPQEKRAAMRRRRNSEENDNMTMKVPACHLSDAIVYLCALLADRPRLIDRYIDYFGETPSREGTMTVSKIVMGAPVSAD
jgi:hypothetical protein